MLRSVTWVVIKVLVKDQVKGLKSQDHGAAVVQYDQELRRVRNALGDEKAHLLDDLVSFLNHTLSIGADRPPKT